MKNLFLLLILLLPAALSAQVMSAGGYDIWSDVFDSKQSTNEIIGGGYTVRHTFGQTSPMGSASYSNFGLTYSLYHGFLPCQPAIQMPTPQITAQGIATNEIKISWSNMTNVSVYTLFRNTSNNTLAATHYMSFPPGTTYYIDTGLATNSLFFYWLKTYSSYGSSSYSMVSSNRSYQKILPAKPVVYTPVVISSNQINLSWQNVQNETSYTLFRSKILASNTATNIGGTPLDVTNYSDMTVSPNTIYYYWLKAYNQMGKSGYSTVTFATTFNSIVYIPVPQIPGNGANLNVSNSFYSWSKCSAGGLYHIEIRTNNLSGRILASNNNILLTNTTLSTLNNDGIYFWRARFFKTAGSVWQPWSSGNTFIIDKTPPIAPVLTFPPPGLYTNTLKVGLSWNAIIDLSGISRYEVEFNGSLFNVGTNRILTNFFNFGTNHILNGTNAWRVRGIDKAANTGIWSSIQKYQLETNVPPAAITGLTFSSTTSNALDLSWTDNNREFGYKIYRNTVNVQGSSTLAGTRSTNIVTFHDTGLTANRHYFYWVIGTNMMGVGALGTASSNWTLAKTASVFSTATTNMTQTYNLFVFTNTATLGTNGITGYKYLWNQSPSGSLLMSDPDWPLAGYTTNIASASGDWYLHLLSYNAANTPSYLKVFGPYIYNSEYIDSFTLKRSAPVIKPNGSDQAMIQNELPLRYHYSGLTLSNGSKMMIHLVKGTCQIPNASTTNGVLFVRATNGNFQINVTGTVINNVIFHVSYEKDPTISADIEILVNYPMDLAAMNDAVIFENVVDPEKDGQVDVYVNAQPGEEINIRIYDAVKRRLVREWKETGGYLKHITYDLRSVNGTLLPDREYGMVISGNGWKKEKKFYVNRWYKK